jgi:hypothetical protein
MTTALTALTACGTKTQAHQWETTSSHVTSEGWVRYQRCDCGVTRVLLNAERVDAVAAQSQGAR